MKSIFLTIVIVLCSIGCYCQVLRTDGEPFSGSVSICNECTTDNYNNPNSRLIVTSNLSLDKFGVSGNAVVGKPKREIGRMIVDFMPNKDGIITFTADQCRALNIVIPDFVRGNGEYQMHIVYEKNATPDFTGYEAYAVMKDSTLTFYYGKNKPYGAYDVEKEVQTWDYDIEQLKKEWTAINEKIRTVVFDQSFKNYRPKSCLSWFYNCINLTDIIGMEDYLNTDNVTNMGSMFSGCEKLTNLDVSHFDTKNVTYMSSMFLGCSNLTSLDVSHFDTKNVTYMSRMFYGCSNLTSLDVSHFDTQKVTDMGGMFSYCSNLTSLDVSHFDTKNVTGMSSMFYGCSNLTSLDVSHFDTQKVTDMYSMFSDCSNLTSLDVSHFDTKNVTDMSSMFNGCSNITILDVSRFDTKNVTGMSNMFYGCSNITSLDVSHFDTQKVIYMFSMFYGCCNITSLDLSNFDTKNVTNMSSIFNNCNKLKTIYSSEKWHTNNSDSVVMFEGCINLIGGKGTKYSKKRINNIYAHIDGGRANPGYFTKK